MVAESGSVGVRSRPDDIEARKKARNSLYRTDSGLRVVLQRDERYTGCRGQVARQQSSHRSAVSLVPPPLPQLRFDISFREPQMKSSRLAVTVIALVLTLTALDLSGAHQPQADGSGYERVSNGVVVAPASMRSNAAQIDTDSEALEGRLVRTVLMASETDPGQPRAAHLCTDAGSNAGAARYCFGTPAPTLQYD